MKTMMINEEDYDDDGNELMIRMKATCVQAWATLRSQWSMRQGAV
jgi:hypothetical protein